MNQNIWGKCTWVLMHTVAINYPLNPTGEDKEKIHTFFTLLGEILPCKYCRQHYRDSLKELPIRADSKMDLVWWTIDLHNKVNVIINKKVLSRKEALQKIMAMYKKNPDNPEAYQYLYFGILLVFIVTVYCFIKK